MAEASPVTAGRTIQRGTLPLAVARPAYQTRCAMSLPAGAFCANTIGFWCNRFRHAPGAAILPGNWGRIIKTIGPSHTHYAREVAMEAHRTAHHPGKPSRFNCNFLCGSIEHARWYKRNYQPEDHIYEVRFDSLNYAYHQGMIMCIPPLRGKSDEDAVRHYWNCDLGVYPDHEPSIQPIEILTMSPMLVLGNVDPGGPTAEH
ncbi:hypothetical protein SAMN05892877_13210 [Rhizobium subbaraonis]|uniref:Uncharacterized protein n=1 Tax=Rhizobium subbaraonis TaxID=908946 RepID=A0A285V0R0_9HYPH|nr:hypothetical protein SAMN05892877_13210 [Rhizobium subbaraonis]